MIVFLLFETTLSVFSLLILLMFSFFMFQANYNHLKLDNFFSVKSDFGKVLWSSYVNNVSPYSVFVFLTTDYMNFKAQINEEEQRRMNRTKKKNQIIFLVCRVTNSLSLLLICFNTLISFIFSC